ncbi:MAG TPA: NUDIX domain-containing protein [Stellaceae bacterium]|jgi:predicted NUDIX family NTP pyrophosphohydrolase|nr:NUDIX domain-containing protein [Stellaceae bacterium]
MATRSAGILVYRRRDTGPEVFLVHPGGPFWAKKDLAAWSIPKGEFSDEENPLAAALREFTEETGQTIGGDFLALTPVKQPSRKIIHAFAVEGEVDAGSIVSNEFEMEWPPRSGRMQRFPEVDRAAWFPLAEARRRIHAGLVPILDELALVLTADRGR